MSLPVDTPAFWKERIDRAGREGKEHYSVYLARDAVWNPIVAEHERILKLETAGVDKILDAGCGYGRMAHLFRPEQYRGIDISPDFIKKAAEQNPGYAFFTCDLRDTAIADNSFDVAFCVSIRRMIVDNLGEDYWDAIEKELKRIARKVLILEYEDPYTYWIV